MFERDATIFRNLRKKIESKTAPTEAQREQANDRQSATRLLDMSMRAMVSLRDEARQHERDHTIQQWDDMAKGLRVIPRAHPMFALVDPKFGGKAPEYLKLEVS